MIKPILTRSEEADVLVKPCAAVAVFSADLRQLVADMWEFHVRGGRRRASGHAAGSTAARSGY